MSHTDASNDPSLQTQSHQYRHFYLMSHITNATWNNTCSCLDIHNTPIRVSRTSLQKALGFCVDRHVAWKLLTHISKLYLLSGETYSFAEKTFNSIFQLVVAGRLLPWLKVSAEVPGKYFFFFLIFVVPCIVILSWSNPTRCNSMQIFIYC